MDTGITLRDLNYVGSELNIEIETSNGLFKGTTDFYCYAEDLTELGTQLKAFPKDSADTELFEAGQDNDSYAGHLLTEARVVDSVGHSSLRLILRRGEPGGGRAEFEVQCEPAALNRLGDQLISWAGDRTAPLSWSPRY